MASRILTWHTFQDEPRYSIGPAYFIEAGYSPVAVRIYAEQSPYTEDAEFQIYDDGVSITSDRSSPAFNVRTGTFTSDPITTIPIFAGDNEELDAEDFKSGLDIEEGSWVTCNCIKDGGGRNFTVHLELLRISGEDESG